MTTMPIGDQIKEPEKWTIVDCLPDIPNIYWVSSWGRLFNSVTNRYLPKNYMDIKENKYIEVSICCGARGDRRMIELHRLVMMEFNPHPLQNVLEVNHIDCIKYHNWLWNLEWLDHNSNMEHAQSNGCFDLGEKRKSSKITNDQADYICKMIDMGCTAKEVEERIHIDGVNINRIYYNIKGGYSWKFLSKNYNFSKEWLG